MTGTTKATRYHIELSRTAEKQLRTIPRTDQIRVVASSQALATDPQPRGTRKVAGYDDVFRIHVGIYRVIYSVSAKTVIVTGFKIGYRGDVYR